jgi:hypothetical protein
MGSCLPLGPEDELLELSMLVGHYVIVAMTPNSTGVQLEDEFVAELAQSTHSDATT